MKIFSGQYLDTYLNDCLKSLEEEVINEDKNTLLNMEEMSYINYLVDKGTISPLIIDFENCTITHDEKLIPAEHFPQFAFSVTPGKSYLKPVITYNFPFKGLYILFQMKASKFSFTTPDIIISNSLDEISFDIINWNGDAEQIKANAEQIKNRIKELTEYSSADVSQYNKNLKQKIINFVSARKTELLRQNDVIKSLGVPLKIIGNEKTILIPIQKKQIVIQKQNTSNKTYPEPELSHNVYIQILEMCQALGISMERLPNTYKNRGEEAIRDLFITNLNPHFDSVTGETFNKSGKTDILIKHEGKNIFVAECKFWRGMKCHHETINQILSYLTWRESKVAILYFVDNKNLQPVLNSIENETPKHTCCLKENKRNHEAFFNYQFHLLNDETRMVELAILVFHFNQKGEDVES